MARGTLSSEGDVDERIMEGLRDLGYNRHSNFSYQTGVEAWTGRTLHGDIADLVLRTDFDGFMEAVYLIVSNAPSTDVTARKRTNQTRSYAVWKQGTCPQVTPRLIVLNNGLEMKRDTLAVVDHEGGNNPSGLIVENLVM